MDLLKIEECGLCKSTFRKPKVLSCLHIFCEKCLRNYLENSQQVRLKCPTCEKNVAIPAKGVSNFEDVLFYSTIQKLMITNNVACSNDSQHPSAVVKCLNCLENLCKKCTQAHTVTGLTKFHKLVLLEEVKEEDAKTVCRASRAPCDVHPNEDYKFFCSYCQLPACIDCRLTQHHEHECVELEKREDDERTKCEESHKELVGKLDLVKNSIERAKFYETDFDFFCSEAEKSIENDANLAIQLVHKRKKDALERLSAARTDEFKKMKDYRERISDMQNHLEHAVLFSKRLLEFANPYELVILSDRLSETAKNFLQAPLQEPKKNLLVLEPLNPPLEKPIGDLKQQPYPYAQLMRTAELKCGWITSIVATNDEILLISDDSKDIRVFDKEAVLKKVIKTSAYKGHQLALVDNGHVIVTESEAHRICILSTVDYGCRIFANSKLSSPCGVAVSAEHVFISDTQENCIFVYTKEGERLNVLRHEAFERPWYLACDESGRILISDHKTDKFYIMNNNGEIVAEFGSRGSKDQELWFPASVAVDQRGNILLADNWNHRIVVLTPNAEFKCHLITRSSGLLYPRSLAVDPINGNLYVGQDDGVLKIFKYYA
ncbi:unnamed protein product [Dimorphilus gyrociliatus]|uniref:Uncharacterized protein n=1 Tax=Dimorphilus gyrociliatus TaxID=2664684 RepID=A0A7I8VMK3_9ANNE|nr:unnamed protein product [Dimorphilus gyrociliatus]